MSLRVDTADLQEHLLNTPTPRLLDKRLLPPVPKQMVGHFYDNVVGLDAGVFPVS